MNAIPGALNNGGGGGDAAAAPAIPAASGANSAAGAGSGPINPNVRDRQALTWTRMSASGSLPPPRSGAASVVVKGRLYMFGVSSLGVISRGGTFMLSTSIFLSFNYYWRCAENLSENCFVLCPQLTTDHPHPDFLLKSIGIRRRHRPS